MPPVEALALFYDFIELTPIGPDGDEMIRRMADRLVGVDLLGPAAKLLELSGDQAARRHGARAGGDAPRHDRIAGPQAEGRAGELALDRRSRACPTMSIISAISCRRARLAALKQWDQALDMIAVDEQPDSRQLARRHLLGKRQLGGRRPEGRGARSARWSDANPLSPEERQQVMRAAIAYSLAGDQIEPRPLARAFRRQDEAEPGRQRVRGGDAEHRFAGRTAFRDMAGQIASVDTLETFMQDFKKRYDAGISFGSFAN
jgi:hypothetical protein